MEISFNIPYCTVYLEIPPCFVAVVFQYEGVSIYIQIREHDGFDQQFHYHMAPLEFRKRVNLKRTLITKTII